MCVLLFFFLLQVVKKIKTFDIIVELYAVCVFWDILVIPETIATTAIAAPTTAVHIGTFFFLEPFFFLFCEGTLQITTDTHNNTHITFIQILMMVMEMTVLNLLNLLIHPMMIHQTIQIQIQMNHQMNHRLSRLKDQNHLDHQVFCHQRCLIG